MSRPAIMQKLARNAKMLGMVVNSESQTAIVIENGANDLTISYVDASFSPSVVGGVDPSASPYLGIGVAAPGKIKIKGSAGATMALTMDSLVAMQVLGMCAALANDIQISGSGDQDLGTVRGHSDLLGMGQ
jgi:hypothetical protein